MNGYNYHEHYAKDNKQQLVLHQIYTLYDCLCCLTYLLFSADFVQANTELALASWKVKTTDTWRLRRERLLFSDK